MEATTGRPVARLNSSSSRKMMSDAVTVPPGLLMRSRTARTLASCRALVNSSRTRTSKGTRAGGVPSVSVPDGASSDRNPETSMRRILASPWPSTVSSSRGRMRGERSMEITEQPARTRARASASSRRMATSILSGALRAMTAAGIIGPPMSLTLEDVRAAGRRCGNRLPRTPVISCQSFDDASGHTVFFKCENLQRAGAFKIRGALNKLLTLTPAERERGVVAFSSGNHAQGVALAARMVGTTAIICMPTDAPALKLEATRNYGAEVVFYDRLTEDREQVARGIVERSGRVLVPPYDDPAIMAGQATAALELLEDVPSLDALLAPVGGGGLMAGCATVARALFPGLQIFGVETETANDT